MGPAATLDFLAKLQRATGAVSDQDHLRVLVDINPKVPDRNAALAGAGPSPGPALAQMAAGLHIKVGPLLYASNTAEQVVVRPDIRMRAPSLRCVVSAATRSVCIA